MFKLIRRKIVEGIIKDFINDLPKYKTAAKLLFLEKKDEIIAKIENAIMETIKKYFKEHLGE